MVNVASVIIQNPRDVGLEVAEKLVERSENVCVFNVALMLVIALATFVVIAKDALTSDDQGQAVLVWMIRSLQRFREANNARFNERDFVDPSSCRSLNSPMWSIMPTLGILATPG